MPKDATKQARRGIGFITFASPEAVERVMRQHHSLAGQELVVDKAAPKTKDPMGGGHLGGLYRGPSSGHLNGMMIGTPVLTICTHPPPGAAGQLSTLLAAGTYPGIMGKLPSHPLLGSSSTVSAYESNPPGLGVGRDNSSGDVSLGGLGLTEEQLSNGLQGHLHGFGGLAASNASVQLAIAQLARAQQAAQLGVAGGMMPPGRGMGMGGNSPSGRASELGGWATNRIFVGKLGKEVLENDIKEYCARFGFVLDVYIPRDKHNKSEHRGFGFVTFETEAAVERILAVEEHHIAGCAIAVDRALPRQEDSSTTVYEGGYAGMEGHEAMSAALGMAALGLGVNGAPGPARHGSDRNRYYYQPY